MLKIPDSITKLILLDCTLFECESKDFSCRLAAATVGNCRVCDREPSLLFIDERKHNDGVRHPYLIHEETFYCILHGNLKKLELAMSGIKLDG